MEEQRQGHIDLQMEFKKHLDISLRAEQRFHDHVARFDRFEEDLLTVIAGPEDPLTKQRNGGMRGEMGQMRKTFERFEYRAANGGINTKWSFWQKMAVGVAPFVVGGGFALITSLVEQQ